MPVFGIDLGTTNSAIATIDESGQPKMIENVLDGKFILPSVVYFEDGATPCVGTEAKNSIEAYPDRVIQFIKRDIGKENGRTINFNGNTEDPITISAYILKRLADYSKEQGYEVEDVVITVPAYFKVEERNATRQAGKIAGFNVLNIVNEPTAAAISYCYGQQGNQKILVYDLGGGTFDVSIIDMITDSNGAIKIEVIDTDGNDRLGGMDWDERLANFVKHGYAEQDNIEVGDIKPEILHKIKTQAEAAKIALSTLMNKNIVIPSSKEGNDAVKINITRDKFNELTVDLLDQTMICVDKLLQENDLKPDDINTVLLVGGSTMMYVIKETVEAKFPNSTVIRNDPNLAVAKGAALYAKITVNEIVREKIEHPAPPVPGPGETQTQTQMPPVSAKTITEAIKDIETGVSSGDNYSISDKVPCSAGVLINIKMDDGNYYNAIDNLLSDGDESPAEQTDEYISSSDGGIRVTFYQNELKITQENKIRVKNKEKKDENHYIKLHRTDNSYNILEEIPLSSHPYANKIGDVKEIGVLDINNSAIKEDDEIIVKMAFSTAGLWAYVTHVKTNTTKEIELKSKNTKTEDEIKKGAARIANTGTAGVIE